MEETVSTSALELRTAYSALQAGAYDAGDLKVTAGGGTREVSVAAGVGFVRGTPLTDQGNYRIRNDAPISSLTFPLGAITTNGTAFPRIDQIIARVMDQSHDGSGLRRWHPEVVTGTATTGATLDNRTGAVADGSMGNSWLRLADVLVPAGATTILAANIRDRRPWARGIYRFIERTAGNYTTVSGVAALIDATNLQPRIESSGRPLKFTLFGMLQHGTAGTPVILTPFVDGIAIPGLTNPRVWHSPNVVGGQVILSATWELTPTLGSHLVGWGWSTGAGTATLHASTTAPLHYEVEEIYRQNADNT